MTPTQLTQGWTPRRVGRRVLVLAETVSTNGVALDAADQTPPTDDGLAVFADYQTMGRGRLGRSWLSPRGAGLLCSVLLITPDDVSEDAQSRLGGRLTLASAVAACEAIRESTEITPAIKWPNDIRVSGRKLGGILIESRPAPDGQRAWAIGIGINCLQHAGHFPPDLQASATSLEIEASHPVDRVAVARSLLQCLDAWLSEPEQTGGDAQDVHAAWMHYAEPLGRRVSVMSGGREHIGTILAIDPSGGLVLQSEDGRREWLDPMQTTLLT